MTCFAPLLLLLLLCGGIYGRYYCCILNALTAYSLFVVTVDREGQETGSEGQSWKVCASSTSDGTRNNFLPPNRGIDAQKV